MALGGYQGWDHVLTVTELQRLVEDDDVRYFYLPAQSGFSRGSTSLDATNELTAWVRQSCSVVSPDVWSGELLQDPAGPNSRGQRQGRGPGGNGLQLYQCDL